MKSLLIALALLLAVPLSVMGGDQTAPNGIVGGDQTIPNGIARVGAPVSMWDGVGLPEEAPRPTFNMEALRQEEVNVAVVDTGIDTEHPDLNVVGGVDCSPQPENMLGFATQEVRGAFSPFAPIAPSHGLPGYQDGYGHGTHVAGTIGALDNGLGVVGVAPGVNLYAVRVLDSTGSGTLESVLCGLEWIRTYHERIGFDVVNMSLGAMVEGDMPPLIAPCGIDYASPAFLDDPIHEAICDLTALDITVVVAAGNSDGSASYHVPAAYGNVIAVSNFADFDGLPGGLAENVACPEWGGIDDALWNHWNGSPFRGAASSDGPAVDIAAPGTCVLSTVPGGYATATGTSMAAPHVTGLVALYKALCPEASNADVRNWLLDSAEPQDTYFYDSDEYGEPLARWGGD